MMKAVESYLSVRRAVGYALSNPDYLLHSFAKFAADRQEVHVRTATAIDWASRAGTVAQRHTRYETIRRFADYIRLEDARHEWLPPNHFGYRKTRPVPHIYSRFEINRLVLHASQLRPQHSLRPHTYVALISLLAATGLRISEALGLLMSDLTSQGLLIRKSKFKKTRLVPVHVTVRAGLQAYLARRQAMHFDCEHLFLCNKGRPLRYGEVNWIFHKLLRSTNLISPHGQALRLHQLRHTFAVRVLESCPPGRERIGQHMLALATYLGHVNINATYWYLESTPELLRDIAVSSESFLCGGQP